jgi:heptaprenylglyceryl phosphate synthase
MSELKICKCCGTPIAEDEQQFNFMHDDFHVCINVFKQRIAMLESQLAAANEWSTEMVTATNELKKLLNGGGYVICKEDKSPISMIEAVVVGNVLERISKMMEPHESRIQEAQNGQ